MRALVVTFAVIAAISAPGCALVIGDGSAIEVEARVDGADLPEVSLQFPEDTRRIYVEDDEYIRTVTFDPGDGAECSRDGGATFTSCGDGVFVWDANDAGATHVIRTYSGGSIARLTEFVPGEALPEIDFVSCDATLDGVFAFSTLETLLGVLGDQGVVCFEDGALLEDAGGFSPIDVPVDGATLIARVGDAVSVQNSSNTGPASQASEGAINLGSNRLRVVGLDVAITNPDSRVFSGSASSELELYGVTASAGGFGSGEVIGLPSGSAFLFGSSLLHGGTSSSGTNATISAGTLTLIGSQVEDAGGAAIAISVTTLTMVDSDLVSQNSEDGGIFAQDVTVLRSSIVHQAPSPSFAALTINGAGGSLIEGTSIQSTDDHGVVATGTGSVVISDTLISATGTSCVPMAVGGADVTLTGVTIEHGCTGASAIFLDSGSLDLSASALHKLATGTTEGGITMVGGTLSSASNGNLFCSDDLPFTLSPVLDVSGGDATGFVLTDQVNGGVVGLCD